MRRKKHFTNFFLLALTVFFGKVDFGFATEDEWNRTMNRLVYSAKKYEKEINSAESFYENEELTRYLHSILNKLFPIYSERMHIRVVQSSNLNAFALPNGAIYINIGLLAKASNEAQIASVLAHEGAHIVNGHVLRSQQNEKFIASGIGLYRAERIPEFRSDYSVELEMEADEVGYEHLMKADYDPREMSTLFENMATSIDAVGIKENTLFETHPKIEERAKRFSQINRNKSGFIGRDVYLQYTNELRILNIHLEVSRFQYQTVILALSKPDFLLNNPTETKYYLGIAFNQRNQTNDLDSAEINFKESIELNPLFPNAYRELGIILYKKNNFEEAKKHFLKYLELLPQAEDRSYIDFYLSQIGKG